MKKLTDVELASVLSTPATETEARLAEELVKLRQSSLVARGYQINKLQNDLFKVRNTRRMLRAQRNVLLTAAALNFQVPLEERIRESGKSWSNKANDPTFLVAAVYLIEVLRKQEENKLKSAV